MLRAVLGVVRLLVEGRRISPWSSRSFFRVLCPLSYFLYPTPMFITVHAAVAIAATQTMGSPALAGLIGLASHFVLDIIPHGDDVVYDRCQDNGWSRLKYGLVFGLPDIVAWIGLIVWVTLSGTTTSTVVVIAAAIGAALPDFLWGLAALFPHNSWLAAFDQLHSRTHHLLGRCLVRPWIGYGVQLATLAAALAALLL
jgi:hypothetical protein